MNQEYKDFLKAYDLLIDHERGFQNQYTDRGNWTSGVIGIGERKGTNRGITAMSYPELDIKNLTVNQTKEIYYQDFWLKCGCHKVGFYGGFNLFDMAVHSGQTKSIKTAQEFLNVSVDGVAGVNTLFALNEIDNNLFCCLFNGQRLLYVCSLKSLFKRYGRGWSRRIAKNLLLLKVELIK